MIKSYSDITPETNIMFYICIYIYINYTSIKKILLRHNTHTVSLKVSRGKVRWCLITRLHRFAFPLTSGRLPWGRCSTWYKRILPNGFLNLNSEALKSNWIPWNWSPNLQFSNRSLPRGGITKPFQPYTLTQELLGWPSTYIPLALKEPEGFNPLSYLASKVIILILTHPPVMLSKVPHLPNYFMFPRSHEKTPQHISSKMTPPWPMTSPAPQRKAEARPIRTSLEVLQGKWRMKKMEDSRRKVSSPWRNSTQNNIWTGLNMGVFDKFLIEFPNVRNILPFPPGQIPATSEHHCPLNWNVLFARETCSGSWEEHFT